MTRGRQWWNVCAGCGEVVSLPASLPPQPQCGKMLLTRAGPGWRADSWPLTCPSLSVCECQGGTGAILVVKVYPRHGHQSLRVLSHPPTRPCQGAPSPHYYPPCTNLDNILLAKFFLSTRFIYRNLLSICHYLLSISFHHFQVWITSSRICVTEVNAYQWSRSMNFCGALKSLSIHIAACVTLVWQSVVLEGCNYFLAILSLTKNK